MRWLGQMQRAFDLMCSYSLHRSAFGGPLADKQTIQTWIADSAAEIRACRLMTLDAARKIDRGDQARVEVSALKFFSAQVLHDVIDRAIQTHGALGVSGDSPLAEMYTNARFARILRRARRGAPDGGRTQDPRDVSSGRCLELRVARCRSTSPRSRRSATPTGSAPAPSRRAARRRPLQPDLPRRTRRPALRAAAATAAAAAAVGARHAAREHDRRGAAPGRRPGA